MNYQSILKTTLVMLLLTVVGNVFAQEEVLNTQADFDLGIVNLQLPESSDSLSDEESVQLTFFYQGDNSVESILVSWEVDGPSGIVSFTEVFNVLINSGDSISLISSHEFDFSAVGNYQVMVSHQLSSDSNSVNDTLISNVTHINHSLPIFEDFEKGDGGWENVSVWPGGYGVWNWETLPIGGNGWRSNSSVSYPPSILQSPIFDLSNLLSDPYLSFDLNVNSDLYHSYVYFEYSLDSGKTFSLLKHESLQYLGDGWTGNDTDLKIRDFELDSLANYDHIIFRLIVDGETGNSEGTYLDHFNLYQPFQDNYRLEGISLPEKSLHYTDSETIRIDIRNVGFNDQSNVPITFVVTGPNGVQVSEEFIATEVSREESIKYTSSSTFDLSEIGVYDITVYTSLLSDDDLSNDTLHFRTSKLSLFEGSLPWLIDFDSILDSVYTEDTPLIEVMDGLSYDHHYGDSQLLIQSDDSLNNYSRYAKLQYTSGRIPNGYGGMLVLSADLSNVEDSVFVKFRYKTKGSNYFGGRNLQIRVDENSEWTYGRYIDPSTQWTNSPEINLTQILSEAELEVSSTTQLRFFFIGFDAYASLSLDDILIYQKYHDVSITSIAGGDSLYFNEKIQIGIRNDGYFEEPQIPVKILLHSNGVSQEVDQIIEGPLAMNDSMSVTIDNPFNLTGIEEYELEVINLLEEDVFATYDTARVAFYLIRLGDEALNSPIIYPNPFHDHLIINDRAVERVELYTIAGVKVLEQEAKTSTASLDVSKLKAGLYVVRLFTAEGQKEYKLIKE